MRGQKQLTSDDGQHHNSGCPVTRLPEINIGVTAVFLRMRTTSKPRVFLYSIKKVVVRSSLLEHVIFTMHHNSFFNLLVVKSEGISHINYLLVHSHLNWCVYHHYHHNV